MLDALKVKGDSLRHTGHYESALQCYERVVEMDHNNVWAWYDKGQVLEALQQYENALQAVREADRLLSLHDRNRTWIHSELGKLYHLLGDQQQAKCQFEMALQYNRHYPK